MSAPSTRMLRSTSRRSPLTPRELDCIEHLVSGSPNREIAARLAISAITVKLHLVSAFKKMGARNRSDAVRIAMLQGVSGL